MPELSTPVEHREEALTLAGDLRRWLASGSLQSPSGAFCAWLDADTGELAFQYPEITGYALTCMSIAEVPSDHELDAAFRAADWLLERFATGDRSARAGWDRAAVYTFDLGMIAAGLQSFGRLAADEQYVELGRSLACELAAYVRSERGLEAVAPDGPGTARPGTWSTSGQPHLVKCVQALLLAGQVDAARTLVQRTISLQSDDGSFATQPDPGHVMLHPHLYAVEGLWIWGSARGDEHALECARAATLWVWEHQLASGGLPRFAGQETGPEQSDVTGQAIRAAVLTGAEPAGFERAVVRLGQIARQTTAGQALVYQPSAPTRHLNSWVTMFGAQALELAAAGLEEFSWSHLI